MQLYCTVFKGQLLETSCNKDVVKDPSPWPVPMYLDARWIYRHFSVAPGNLCSIFRISCKLSSREVWETTQERYTRRYLDRFCVQWTTIKMKQLVPQRSRTNEMPWFRALPIPQRQTASILDLVVMDPNEKTKIPVLAIQKRKEGQGAHAQYFLVFGIRSYSCLLKNDNRSRYRHAELKSQDFRYLAQWIELPIDVGSRFRLCLTMNRRLTDKDPRNVLYEPSPASLDHYPMALQRILMAFGCDLGRQIVPDL